jgi:hypothetical protein
VTDSAIAATCITAFQYLTSFNTSHNCARYVTGPFNVDAYQVPTHQNSALFHRHSTTASEQGEESDDSEAAGGGASALSECSDDLRWDACLQAEAKEEDGEEAMGRQDCGGGVSGATSLEDQEAGKNVGARKGQGGAEGTWAVKGVEAGNHVVACGRDANAKRRRNLDPCNEELTQTECTDMGVVPAARAHVPCPRVLAEAGAGLQVRGKKRRHTHAHVQNHTGGGLMLGLFDGPASIISYMM